MNKNKFELTPITLKKDTFQTTEHLLEINKIKNSYNYKANTHNKIMKKFTANNKEDIKENLKKAYEHFENISNKRTNQFYVYDLGFITYIEFDLKYEGLDFGEGDYYLDTPYSVFRFNTIKELDEWLEVNHYEGRVFLEGNYIGDVEPVYDLSRQYTKEERRNKRKKRNYLKPLKEYVYFVYWEEEGND